VLCDPCLGCEMAEEPKGTGEEKRGPFSTIKPRWILENLGAATVGFGVGHLLGGATAGLVAGHPKVMAMDPKKRERILDSVRAMTGPTGALTLFSLNQMRNAMNERLRTKRHEEEERQKSSTNKTASGPLLSALRRGRYLP
jgi:hypothetical protein